MNETVAKPFLKWAGGKGQLLQLLEKMLPNELKEGRITTYIEPFVGGGAMLFYILQKYQIQRAIIIDINKELINCYSCIKADVSNLVKCLLILKNEYFASDNKENYFYTVRSRYNSILLNEKFDFEKAADFIFLNKTCFNGLYRVNKNGNFNVPFGKYKNPTICDEDNLFNVSKLLQKTEILHGNYFDCKKYVAPDTLIYFDPPYRPLIEKTSFVGYSKNGFTDNDQIGLYNFFNDAHIHDTRLMLSNSDPKNTNEADNFFDDLYKDFLIERIKAKRMINCQADKRGDITEIIIRNY